MREDRKPEVTQEIKTRIDYSHEVKPLKAAWKRNLLILMGTIFFVLGVIGIFLPLCPTTPFLLLSAACFARASARFYNWLMNHYILGPYIRDWRSNKGIPKRTKLTAIFLILICFAISSFFLGALYLRLVFLSVGLGVIIYILKLPVSVGR